MRNSYEVAGQALIFLNVELGLVLAAIQKCLNLLHDDLSPNTKKLWLSNQRFNVRFYQNRTSTVLKPRLDNNE